jgi:hypothetical protein
VWRADVYEEYLMEPIAISPCCEIAVIVTVVSAASRSLLR